jgi:hypothetical protein
MSRATAVAELQQPEANGANFTRMPSSVALPGGRRGLRVAATLILAAVVGVLVWLFVRNRQDDNAAPATTTAATERAGASSVVRATPSRLATLARLSRRPIYWAGPKRGMKLELTQTPGGRIYVRYLPPHVKLGDRSGRYLIVGTYRVRDAYGAIQAAARERGAHRYRLRRRALAVYNDDSPTNVYFAAPGSRYQVEVYFPNPKRALALVESGAIRPVKLTTSGG